MSDSAVDIYNLAKSKVLDGKGNSIEMSSLWRESKAIIVFLRHFACIACRAHAVQVWAHRELYQKNNAKIYFIGNGDPQYIEGFKQELGLNDAMIFTDPSLNTFRFSGFKRGFLSVVNAKSLKNATELYRKGFRQNQLQAQGDHWQLGGVLVISKQNEVAFHFISQAFGDFPPEKDLEV